MAELNITVETLIHDAFADVARNVCRKFGVRVDDVRFEWLSSDTFDGPRHELLNVNMQTTKEVKHEEPSR